VEENESYQNGSKIILEDSQSIRACHRKDYVTSFDKDYNCQEHYDKYENMLNLSNDKQEIIHSKG